MKVQSTAVPSIRPHAQMTGAHGYRSSSDELHSGLEVDTLSLTSLPPDLVSELIRLRRTWGGASGNDAHALN